MKTKLIKTLTGFLLLGLVTLTACNKEDPAKPSEAEEEIPQLYLDLPGPEGNLITKDQKWSHDTVLSGPHFVLPGVTLTIEAGVTVSFEYHNGNSDDVGTIIVLPGDATNFKDGPKPSGQLIAIGTPDKPIVFTSARSDPQINDWGGIILIGDAPTNIQGNTGNVEGLPSAVSYGGDKANDNSGQLRYVRIEYSGYSIAEGSELQGLSLYSVGDETEIDHINIYKTSDDGIEIFGGTVALKYIVIYGVSDDCFDFDQGWKGRGQFWLGIQVPGADNGFENDGVDGQSNEFGPTDATIFNATIYGAGSSTEGNYGLKLRENLQGSYNNIIIANFVGAPFYLQGAPESDEEADPTYENYGQSLTLSSIMTYNNGEFETPASGPSDLTRYASSYTKENPLFKDPASFNFALQEGSPALSAGNTPPADGFFEQVSYIGALGTTDWTQEGSWVRWP